MIPAAPQGFAYLFEKFPSFSQTFCVREVIGLRNLGWEFPVFSVRQPSGEPMQDCFSKVGMVTYLPEKFDAVLAEDVELRRAARKAQEDMRNLWGNDCEKRRIYEALWLLPKLRAAGVEHVHVHFAGIAARTAFWLNRLGGIQYSVTAHANDIFRDEPVERLRQIFTAAKLVITVSDYSLRYLQQQFPELSGKFARVYNGIETSRFQVERGASERPIFASVGRYIEKKGFEFLIASCGELKEADFECQIVGHGPLEAQLKEQVASLGLEGKVFIAGPKMEGDIKALLARSRAFVLPCITGEDGSMDNLPTVIMEAMAAGLPVVSTAVAGVPEMVVDAETGYVVPERDVPAFADAMKKVLVDETNARALGERGRARCLDLFDVSRTAAALAEALISHGAARRPA